MRFIMYLRRGFLLLFTLAFLFSVAEAKNNGKKPDDEKKKLKIICSFSDYASIVEFIVLDKGEASYIAHGESDPHFVPPKPSYAMMLKSADMWITTGMDLEGWAPTLLDKARNKNIMDGEAGFVSVSDGVKILHKVEKGDRTEGDVHLMGNPHINAGPVNWKTMADNITIGLTKIDPENQAFYENRRDEFKAKVDHALFGEPLVKMFGAETLCKMLENKTLFTFLEKELDGKKLVENLGGWLKKAIPFRGKRIMAYHKNWAYFTDTFGLEIVGYIEPKPGIPPSAKHVQNSIKLIKNQNIKLMLVASYFEQKTPQMIENKTGIKALFLPLFVGGAEGVDDNFGLIDNWIDQVLANIK